MGRQTAGVQGMKFRGDDELLAMDVVPEDSKQDLLVVTNELRQAHRDQRIPTAGA